MSSISYIIGAKSSIPFGPSRQLRRLKWQIHTDRIMVRDPIFHTVIDLLHCAGKMGSKAIRSVAIARIGDIRLNEDPVQFAFTDRPDRSLDLISNGKSLGGALIGITERAGIAAESAIGIA